MVLLLLVMVMLWRCGGCFGQQVVVLFYFGPWKRVQIHSIHTTTVATTTIATAFAFIVDGSQHHFHILQLFYCLKDGREGGLGLVGVTLGFQ